MNRSRIHRSAVGARYFPIVALLVLGAGVLAPLLFMLVREAPPPAPSANLALERERIEQERAALEWRMSALQETHRRTADELERGRLSLGQLESSLQHLVEERQRLELALSEMNRLASTTDQQRDRAASDLAILKEQIALAEHRLESTQRNADNKPNAFAVIPYVGKNGTRRRPIYIECRSDGVFLQPDGIAFTQEDFSGPLGPGNPLATALRLIRDQIVAEQQAKGGPPEEPYPLLLVRPDGVQAYYLARAAMVSWGSEFGYEFIDEDWAMSYPDVNIENRAAIEQALAVARDQQRKLAEAAPGVFRDRKGGHRRSNNLARSDGTAPSSAGSATRTRRVPVSSVAGAAGGFADAAPVKTTISPYANLTSPSPTNPGYGAGGGPGGGQGGGQGAYNSLAQSAPYGNAAPGYGGGPNSGQTLSGSTAPGQSNSPGQKNSRGQSNAPGQGASGQGNAAGQGGVGDSSLAQNQANAYGQTAGVANGFGVGNGPGGIGQGPGGMAQNPGAGSGGLGSNLGSGSTNGIGQSAAGA